MNAPFQQNHSSTVTPANTYGNRASFWLWSRKRPETSEAATTASIPSLTEPKKVVILKDLSSILAWHSYAIIPCLTTVVLLYINFSEYTIGVELGRSRKGTENILALLQQAAKVYEILGTICLTQIVQQWMQWSLIGDGTLFGLLCAEISLGSIQFLISKEYLAAISYGFRSIFCWGDNTKTQHRQQQKVLALALFIALACILSTFAGTASATLLKPQMDWFFGEGRDWIPDNELELRPLQCYAYIMIDPRLGTGLYAPSRLTNIPIPEYWQYAWYLKNPRDSKLHQKLYTHQQHTYMNLGYPTVINYTTTWDRPLLADANWSGASRFTTAIRFATKTVASALTDYEPTPKNRGSETQFVAKMSGIETYAVCRRRRKVPCNNGNDSEWCFTHVTVDGSEGELLSSRDLLLMANFTLGGELITAMLPRLWMTEGPRIKNRRFTDSVVFVVEDSVDSPTPEPLLTICTVNATMQSVVARSPEKLFSPDRLQFLGYLEDFKSPTGSPSPPRTFLYHENWLDMIHELLDAPSADPIPVMQHENKTYAPRSDLKPTENHFLKPWALELQGALSYTGGPLWWPSNNSSYVEAAEVEMIVGGSFIAMLTRKATLSNSQYRMSFFGNATARATQTQTYPEELMPEPSISCQSEYSPVQIYHEIYGFRPTSTAAILSMFTLLTLTLIILLGSIWQCQKGAIIQAWGSLPEYVALCLGTTPPLDAMENTCVGIDSKETMKTVVMIRETTPDHLELIAVPFSSSENPHEVGPPSSSPENFQGTASPSLPPRNVSEVLPGREYGYLGKNRRRELLGA